MAVTAHASGTKTATLGTFTVTIASPGVFTYSSNQLANGDAVTLSTKTTNLGDFTVTIASPAVFTLTGNTLANGEKVVLSTTGALPTGLTAGTTYFVVNNGTDGTGKFRLAATSGGADINTSGSQSGTHSIGYPGILPTGLTAGTTYYVVNNGTDGSGKFRLATSVGGSDINTSGSQSGTHSIATEHFLSSPNVAGTFQVVVDTVNMAANDVLELRVYQMVLTSGTARVVYFASYLDAQPTDDLIKVSVPISNELTDTNALRFSLKQTYGTSRNFPWKVLKFA